MGVWRMMSDDRFSSDGRSVSTGPMQAVANNGTVVIATEALMQGRSEVHIQHRGEIYRLRITSRGKLILHK